MTNEEALYNLKQKLLNTDMPNTIRVAISAIEKQIPKKPERVEELDDGQEHYIQGMRIMSIYHFECPDCHKLIIKPYSCECGQRIDWSEGAEA